MKKAAIVLFIGLISSACLGEESLSSYSVDNSLSECISITGKRVFHSNGLVLLATDWRNKKTIGDCGCKSAGIYYDVIAPGSDTILTHGIVSSLNKDTFNFVLNADETIFRKQNYELRISCKNQ